MLLKPTTIDELDGAIPEENSLLPVEQTVWGSIQVHPELHIFALGSAQVKLRERTLKSADWTYLKGRELLFYLLCHPPRTKEQIGLALWPDASPAHLRSNFRVTLHHLRRALGRPDWIVFEHEHYAFNRSLAYWFDVEAFEADLFESQRLLANAPGQPTAVACRYLERATNLYHGDFLDEIVTGDWSLLRREELRTRYQALLLTLGRVFFAEGDYARAADAYRRLIAHDGYLEFAHCELMRCYARLGERSQALRHYQALVERIRVELDALPDPETTALFEHLRHGEAI